MRRDEDTPVGGIEFLDIDPADSDADELLPTSDPRLMRWIPALAATGAVTAVLTLITGVSHGPSAFPPAHTPTSSRSSGTERGAPTTAARLVLPITVVTAAAPLLGVKEGWELFGRGDGAVVRIQFARGLITRTTLPGPITSGAMSFIVGTTTTIVRPLDFLPGYLVPDGQPARRLAVTPTVGQSEPVFPGPEPDHVWAPPARGGPADIGLARLDGASLGPLLPVPAGAAVQDATPDGAGYLLFHELGGTYDARPSGLRRITTGQVLAVGPTRWLASECGGRGGECNTVVIDQAPRTRHVLATGLNGRYILAGAISPNGLRAALISGTGPPLIQLLDLSTGAVRALPVRVDQSAFDPAGLLVWSPDSRWLFSTDENGHLYAIDADTGQITDLTFATGHSLPPLTQIAIRAAP